MGTGAERRWGVVAASVQGVSHRKTQQPCQDAHWWCEPWPGVLVAAVADGAGSAEHSQLGSARAVKDAVEEATRHLRAGVPAGDEEWRTLLNASFEVARQAVGEEAALIDASPNDLATTLLVAVAAADWLAVAQVGDGAIVARLADGGGYLPATRPPQVEYLNETTFLTTDAERQQLQFSVHRCAIDGLALLTDGLEMLALKMPDGAPHTPFFEPLLRFVQGAADRDQAEEQLRAFLQSPRITARADDDLTLFLAVLS